MKFNSLKTKLLLMILLVVILSNATLGIASLIISKNQISSSVNENLSNIAAKIADDIYNINDSQFSTLEALATQPFMKSEVSLKTKNDEVIAIAKRNLTKFKNISFYDESGDTYMLDGSLKNFGDADFFKEALSGKNIVSDPIYDSNIGETLMYYAIPVYNIHHVAEGVLCAIVFGDRLSQIVSVLQFGKESHPIVINMKTGQIIGKFDKGENNKTDFTSNNKSKLSEIINEVKSGKTGHAIYIDEMTGKKMTCAYQPVGSNCDWAVFCAAPYSDYFYGLQILRIIIVTIMVIALISSTIICFVFLSISLKSLKKVNSSIHEIATGNADLTKRIDVKSNDEIGSVVIGFNTFSSKLQNIVSKLKASNLSLTDAGNELDARTNENAESITEIIEQIRSIYTQILLQGNSVEATSCAVTEIATNINSLEKMIQNQSDGVLDASNSVEKMIQNIASVNSFVDKMANSFEILQHNAQTGSKKQMDVNERILAIEEQSKMLQDANKTILSIAGETNLLAMNAAIEAAHAGNAGRGFSVVADEIRKLSETSSVQSKTIGNQLNEIRNSIQEVVSASKESSGAFSSVSTEIEETGKLVRHIKTAMEEQNADSQKITKTLQFMNESTSEVSFSSKEMAEGNKAILSEIQNLEMTTQLMQQSMDEMTNGAMKIDATGKALDSIVNKMKSSIRDIDTQINQFRV